MCPLIKSSGFNADGTLDYTYENVTINSSDTRPGKGDRTVPYLVSCYWCCWCC